jgi:hypothetical protein
MGDGSGTSVRDVVDGKNGELVGPTPPTWIGGGGVKFNDIDSNHIEVPHASAFDFGDQDFTISMLVRYASAPTNTDRWLIKGTHGAPGTGKRYELYHTGSSVRFAIDDDVTKSRVQVPPEPFVTGDWVHVVAIRDTTANTLSLYANTVMLVRLKKQQVISPMLSLYGLVNQQTRQPQP